jgi:hypothetical protein
VNYHRAIISPTVLIICCFQSDRVKNRNKKKNISEAWWNTQITLGPRRLRQKGYSLGASLAYIARLSPKKKLRFLKII